MANLNAVVANKTSKTIEQKNALVMKAFAERTKKLIGLRDAKKITQAQYEEFLSVLKNRQTRALYQITRNARPDVLAKRKTYNQKRYNDQKIAVKRARDLGIL